MDHFKLVSEYAPTGDQPQAIADLVKGFQEGNHAAGRYRLRKDVHHGQRHPGAEQADADHCPQ